MARRREKRGKVHDVGRRARRAASGIPMGIRPLHNHHCRPPTAPGRLRRRYLGQEGLHKAADQINSVTKLARTEVVKTLLPLLNAKRINIFQMNKALSKHIWSLNYEDAGPVTPVKPEQNNKKPKKEREGKQQKGGSLGLLRMWEYIKQNNLQDPADKRNVICDEKAKQWNLLGTCGRMILMQLRWMLNSVSPEEHQWISIQFQQLNPAFDLKSGSKWGLKHQRLMMGMHLFASGMCLPILKGGQSLAFKYGKILQTTKQEAKVLPWMRLRNLWPLPAPKAKTVLGKVKLE
ncbi:hypothetical protein OPV22_027708 [Ensete ventricosum]|uniref:DM2 domain-containing protein n=1 Tax=Ensete ventricosum TaxID=4639 RepID=A0AAV8Q6I9_ENSVE|nr:hypothetical protein OPV22_027708 [Ensete ventricosum]